MSFSVASTQISDLGHMSLLNWFYLPPLSDLTTYLQQLSLGIAQIKLWNLHHFDHRLLILLSVLSGPMASPVLLSSS